MRRCRIRGCKTVLCSLNAGERLCYVHRQEQRRMRFLRNMPGSDELTPAEKRRWIRGDAD